MKPLRRFLIGALATAFAASTGLVPTSAQTTLRPLTLGLTSQTANEWPEYVDVKMGFFAANGLKTDIIYTGSAAAGAQQLTAGSLDISEVSSTQLIEAVQGGAPITAVVEHSTKVPYSIVGAKGVTSLSQLKGKTIIVGGVNDITRVFTDKVFASAHLQSSDFTYTFAGATSARFAALLNGGVAAAILFPPFSFRAAGMGYPVLADVPKYFPSFLFDTFAVRSDWAKSHGDLITAFAKAYLEGVRWLYDPANRKAAIALLSETTNTSESDATQTYDLFITKLHIYSPTGIVTSTDVGPVLDALVKIGQLKQPVPSPKTFYDNAFVQRATAPGR